MTITLADTIAQMIKREKIILSHADGWTDRHDFRITDKVAESDEITSFYLAPVSGEPLPSFLPGQYISLMTDVPEFRYKQARQYSLSERPRTDYYRISVKKEAEAANVSSNGEARTGEHRNGSHENSTVMKSDTHDIYHPGYISNILHNSKQIGDIVQLSHPAGEFFCDVEHTTGPLVLISAGVGLTPMLSMLNTALAQTSSSPSFTSSSSQRPISWIHATRSSEVQAFAKHIRHVTKTHDNVSAIISNKRPREDEVEGVDYRFKSRMTLNVLDGERDLYLRDKEAMYLVCGPRGSWKIWGSN